MQENDVCSIHLPFNLDLTLSAVSRISLVSPERSRQIEMILLRMAQGGQLRGRVSENQLIELLDQVRSLSFVSSYYSKSGFF